MLLLVSAGCRQQLTTGKHELPPAEDGADSHLEESPRHGEWVTYTAPGGDEVRAWLVYPERDDKAPVVIVIHEIYGLTDWVRAVTDQLASEGFIAIAPDYLSGKTEDGSEGLSKDEARNLIMDLEPDEIVSLTNGAARYATSLDAATEKFATVGFCWGGAQSFYYATQQPDLTAAVVYYGSSPQDITKLHDIGAATLGLYGSEDNRVLETVSKAEEELHRMGKPHVQYVYEGAGHAFLRQQDGMDGANMKAAEEAWPTTIEFLMSTLE